MSRIDMTQEKATIEVYTDDLGHLMSLVEDRPAKERLWCIALHALLTFVGDKAELEAAMARMEKETDLGARAVKLLKEIRNGKHSVPGLLTQIDRLLGERMGEGYD